MDGSVWQVHVYRICYSYYFIYNDMGTSLHTHNEKDNLNTYKTGGVADCLHHNIEHQNTSPGNGQLADGRRICFISSSICFTSSG